jgi:hypothetical protein
MTRTSKSVLLSLVLLALAGGGLVACGEDHSDHDHKPGEKHDDHK